MYSLVYGFYYLIQIVLSCIVLEYPSYWKSCFMSFCFVFKLWPSHWGANSFEPLTFKAFHLLSQSAGRGVLFSTVVEKQLHENQNWRNNDMRLPNHYVPFWLVQMSQWLAACSCPAHKGSSVKLVSWRAAHICGFLHSTAKKGLENKACRFFSRSAAWITDAEILKTCSRCGAPGLNSDMCVWGESKYLVFPLTCFQLYVCIFNWGKVYISHFNST